MRSSTSGLPESSHAATEQSDSLPSNLRAQLLFRQATTPEKKIKALGILFNDYLGSKDEKKWLRAIAIFIPSLAGEAGQIASKPIADKQLAIRIHNALLAKVLAHAYTLNAPKEITNQFRTTVLDYMKTINNVTNENVATNKPAPSSSPAPSNTPTPKQPATTDSDSNDEPAPAPAPSTSPPLTPTKAAKKNRAGIKRAEKRKRADSDSNDEESDKEKFHDSKNNNHPNEPDASPAKRINDGTLLKPYSPPVTREEVAPLSAQAAFEMGELVGDIMARANAFCAGELYRAKLRANITNNYIESNEKLALAEKTRDLLEQFVLYQRIQNVYELNENQLNTLADIEVTIQKLNHAIEQSIACDEKRTAHFSDEATDHDVPDGIQQEDFIKSKLNELFGEPAKAIPPMYDTPALITAFTNGPISTSSDLQKKISITSTEIPGYCKVASVHYAHPKQGIVTELHRQYESEEAMRLPRTKNWMFGGVSIPNPLLLKAALIQVARHKELALIDATKRGIDDPENNIFVQVRKGNMTNDEYLAYLMACRFVGLNCSKSNIVDEAQMKLFADSLVTAKIYDDLPLDLRYGPKELARQSQSIQEIVKVENDATKKSDVAEETADAPRPAGMSMAR